MDLAWPSRGAKPTNPTHLSPGRQVLLVSEHEGLDHLDAQPWWQPKSRPIDSSVFGPPIGNDSVVLSWCPDKTDDGLGLIDPNCMG